MKLIFIHGVNDQKTGYSNELFQRVWKQYKKKNPGEFIDHGEILWADVTSVLISQYLLRQYNDRRGLWRWITRAIDPLVMQVINYVQDKKNERMDILKRVDAQFRALCSPGDEVIVCAHSLGSVIMFDYLFGFKPVSIDSAVSVSSFITFGSPIPLFISAMGYPLSHVQLPDNIGRWLNVLDPDDVIARVCSPHFHYPIVADKHINTSLLPLRSHCNYWRSKSLAAVISSEISKN